MQRLFIVILVVLLTYSVGAAPLPDDLLSRLDIKYDKFEDTTRVKSAIEGSAGDGLNWSFLEILITKEDVKCFMTVMYIAPQSIDLKRVVFLIDNTRYELPTDTQIIYGSTSYGYYGERLIFSADIKVIWELICDIAATGTEGIIEYKLIGSRGSKFGVFTKTQIQAWIDVLEYYKAYAKSQ